MTRRTLVSFLAGSLFAVGLVVGGMTQPGKVLGFLDLAGAWDPSLALVMGGALLLHMPLLWLITRRSAPLLDTRFHLPTRRDLDRRLTSGAALFGVGWGLGGYCPGPGLVSMTAGAGALVFTLALVVGMYAQRGADPAVKH